MELQGKLVQLLPLQTGNGKNGPWKKQECILEIPGQYPKKVCFSLWGDKIQDSILQIGNQLTVQFDIESREFNGRWYNEVKAWKVEQQGKSASTTTPPVNKAMDDVPPPSYDDFLQANTNTDDLPF